MSLNARFLRSFPLDDEAVERILSAHQAEMDALNAECEAARAALSEQEKALHERDEYREQAAAHQAEAEQLREELAQFRQQVHEERTASGRQAALSAALTEAGANAQAVPLLAQAVRTTEADWDGVSLRDASAAIGPVVSQYAAFFSAPTPIPTVRITPPLAPARNLTQADLRTMSAQEINQHWPQVRQALRVPD